MRLDLLRYKYLLSLLMEVHKFLSSYETWRFFYSGNKFLTSLDLLHRYHVGYSIVWIVLLCDEDSISHPILILRMLSWLGMIAFDYLLVDLVTHGKDFLLQVFALIPEQRVQLTQGYGFTFVDLWVSDPLQLFIEVFEMILAHSQRFRVVFLTGKHNLWTYTHPFRLLLRSHDSPHYGGLILHVKQSF